MGSRAQFILASLLLSACASTKPLSPTKSAAQEVPECTVAYQGSAWVQREPSQGQLKIRSPKGWTFGTQAPTKVWVYSSEGLGNAPERVDAPKFGGSPATEIQLPFFVVPLRSGPAKLAVRVSSALCRDTLCVPIDQELTLVETVSEKK